MRARSIGFMLCASLSLCGCGYTSLQQQDEDVKTSWSQVVSVYQRRADLAASLASTVKANSIETGATSEQQVIGVAQESARSGSSPAAPAVLNDPAAFASYQAMQDRLTDSLENLLGISSSYPQLQSDANFRDLRTQLAETEERLAEARNRYVAAVRAFNTSVRTFPTDLTARVFDFRPKPSLGGSN